MDCLYFCGNSLGLQPKQARTLVIQELDKWQQMYVHVLVWGKIHVLDILSGGVWPGHSNPDTLFKAKIIDFPTLQDSNFWYPVSNPKPINQEKIAYFGERDKISTLFKTKKPRKPYPVRSHVLVKPL